MTQDEIEAADALLNSSSFGPDAEDCERFASRYGNALLAIARAALRNAGKPLPTVEEMARVICDQDWAGAQPWDRKPESFKNRYRGIAKAVLLLFVQPQPETQGDAQCVKA